MFKYNGFTIYIFADFVRAVQRGVCFKFKTLDEAMETLKSA